MASTTTINGWLDELALSIAGNGLSTKSNKRKFLDGFRKRVRYHNYARTNQFEVEERLTGLEEKFQILNREELSDELYQRRIELKAFQNKWIPDVLDLLIKLSGDSTKSKKLLELYAVKPRPATPPQLTWKDLQADDPIDPQDRLWRVPKYTDYSSDEDEFTNSSAKSTPETKKVQGRHEETSLLRNEQIWSDTPNYELPDQISEGDHGGILAGTLTTISEITLVRETLFMLRGFPTRFFGVNDKDPQFGAEIKLQSIHVATLRRFMIRAISIRQESDVLQHWVNEPSSDEFIHILQSESEDVLRKFHSAVDKLQENILNARDSQPVSLLGTVHEAERASEDVVTLAHLARSSSTKDPISCLESLYEMLILSQRCCNDREFRLLCSCFHKALRKYLEPLWLWLTCGTIKHSTSRLFIKKADVTKQTNTLWHDWYVIDETRQKRAPAFLQSSLETIFTCGKTAAFQYNLYSSSAQTTDSFNGLEEVMTSVQTLSETPLIPFADAFESIIRTHISNISIQNTEKLKQAFNSAYGFGRTLDAIDHIYFRKDGVVTMSIESKVFDRIDRCIDSWNDRFLIADMLEEIYSGSESPVDPDQITIHASYTSSRSMQSRRQSVKIMNALAVDYALPWPMANIIPVSSMQSYRRISLILTQISRAKYMLERTAYIRVQSVPVSQDATATDQKFAQALTYMLLQFVNTQYDHLMTGVILPMTAKMSKDLDHAATFDDMISVHKTYIDRMEHACLSSPKLKMLKDALIALLDLCIRFADLVSDPQKLDKRDSDMEAQSFTSAQSRRRRERQRRRRRRMLGTAAEDELQSDSESEEDDELEDPLGEGYSSFIVLDEDTTVMKELRKLRVQFLRQMEFYIAGLRGVARGTETLDEFEMLAERLSCRPTDR